MAGGEFSLLLCQTVGDAGSVDRAQRLRLRYFQCTRRWERRAIQKENEKAARDQKRAETERIRGLVELARRLDPRLRQRDLQALAGVAHARRPGEWVW